MKRLLNQFQCNLREHFSCQKYKTSLVPFMY